MQEHWFEEIENYLYGEMNHEERLHFESEVAENEELSSLLEQYKEIAAVVGNRLKYKAERTALKQTLEEIKTKYAGNNPGMVPAINGQQTVHALKEVTERGRGIIKTIRRLIAAAAILAFICLGSLWYFKGVRNNPSASLQTKKKANNNKPANNDSLSDYGNKNPGNLVNREKENSTIPEDIHAATPGQSKSSSLYNKNFKPDITPAEKSGALEEAFAYYENHEYKKAIKAFEDADLTFVNRAQSADQNTIEYYRSYYKAISYMAANKVSKAIPELHLAIAKSSDSLSTFNATWYLALAYIDQGGINRAGKLLTQMAAGNYARALKSKASTLLDELKATGLLDH